MSVTLKIDIPRKLLVGLSVPAQNSMVAKTTWEIGKIVKAHVTKRPGESNSPVIWKSDKQRRYYFAMRRQQGLGPKYTRTGRLLSSWTMRRLGTTGTIVKTEGASAAGWVQSSANQQPQHRATGWVTDQQAVSQVKQSDINRIAEMALKGQFR